MMDRSKEKWHGIPRTEIPWYPQINEEKCIGCKLCYVSCGRLVFEFDEQRRKAVVARPYNCMVGCSTCATVCPSAAIDFPDREMIQKIEREHRILKHIPKEAKVKMTKVAYEKARKHAEDILLKETTGINFEVTGHINERQLTSKLHELLKEHPCDVVRLEIQTPTLKGCWDEKAPSYAKFQLVSTNGSPVTTCAEKVHKLLEENECVVITER